MKVSEHGQELIIEDLEFADKGEYECSATNDVRPTPVVATFTLQVEGIIYISSILGNFHLILMTE